MTNNSAPTISRELPVLVSWFSKITAKVETASLRGCFVVRYLSSVSSCSFLLSSLSLSLSLSFSLSLSLQSLDSLYLSRSRLRIQSNKLYYPKSASTLHQPALNPSLICSPFAPFSLFFPNHECQPDADVCRGGSSGMSRCLISNPLMPLTPPTYSDAPISMSGTSPLGSPNTCSQRSSLSPVRFNT